ncbi:MAG: FAD-binding oxidoreductase [Chloroflexota bacterium]|nr:FAD-binding oxidoreductase [Chloroflexota bacterium]
MRLPRTADVVIVGGGVMGVSTAYHLAKKGCEDVLLLERERFFGTQATGKCAGGIRYQFGTEINVWLSKLSLPMLHRFEEQLGQPIDLNLCGYLFLLTEPQDVEVFRQNVEMQHRLGVETEWLEPSDIAELVPVIDLHGVLAGTLNPNDGLADPSSVVQGYVSGAGRLGAALMTDVEVTDVLVANGRVKGVATDQGVVSTPAVVNAAGPWAGVVGEMAGLEIPVAPLRRQIVVTGPIPELPEGFPFVIDFAQSLYFHPEGEGLLTGMSNPNESYGFDQSVDKEWELVHLGAAVQRMPLLERAGLANRWSGLYEVSPDAHPILGRVPQLEGFYCINGFSGHGFMHGPICGLLLAEEILAGGARTLDISPLYLDRFQEGEGIVEYNVV